MSGAKGEQSMARKQDVFVNRRKKKQGTVLPAIAVLAVSGLMALSGAFAWQTISGDTQRLEIKEALHKSQSEALNSAAKPPEDVSSSASATASESSLAPQSTESGSSGTADAGGSSQSSAAAPEETGSPDIVASVIGKSERVPSTYFDDAMFVGDSITNGILSYQLMQNTTVISHTGINPDSIRSQKVFRDASGNLVSIPDAMAQYPNAKKIYIMLGANSAAWMEREIFMDCYGQFLRSAMKQHPDATFYVQSILPINGAKFKAGPYASQPLTNEKIRDYNKGIAAIAKSAGAYYLDVASAFRDENLEMPSEATNDGMHFGTSYYQKWFDYLKTHTLQA